MTRLEGGNDRGGLWYGIATSRQSGTRNDGGVRLPRPATAGLAMTMVRNDKDATGVFFC